MPNNEKVEVSNITEQQFMDMLITDTRQRLSLAHLLGWTVAHFRPAQTALGWRTAVQADGKGFPDLVLVKMLEGYGGRIIYAELKRKGEHPSPEQITWLDLLWYAGQEVYLWYPLDIDEIGKILQFNEPLKVKRRAGENYQSFWGNRR